MNLAGRKKTNLSFHQNKFFDIGGKFSFPFFLKTAETEKRFLYYTLFSIENVKGNYYFQLLTVDYSHIVRKT